MGSRFPLVWFWPLAATPSTESGLSFETNGFEDPWVTWPPPDPDRLAPRHFGAQAAFIEAIDIAAFRKRQEADLERFEKTPADGPHVRRKPFHQRLQEVETASPILYYDDLPGSNKTSDPSHEAKGFYVEQSPAHPVEEGEESWRNSEGERLDDFGVDEDAEFYDEDDVPLAELLRRRRA
ncbi:Palmitoyltransferase [Elasticomyces elasticus]|nr:Palmitoyltransferase [Elasticomyces elasticus]